MKFIVKLFPEITIKSPPVRKRFIKQLRKNIRAVLKSVDEGVVVTGNWDFIELATSSDDSILVAQVKDLLGTIPGIAYWQQVKEYPLTDFDDIVENAVEVNRDVLKGKTFRVTCQRSGKHEFKSVDVEKYVGGGLNQQTDAAGVKLKNPDVVVKIEIKKQRYFLVTDRGPGLGGYPLGSMEPCLSLISGGFDSTVSSFLMMKRGVRTHFCFFNLGGHAHELAVKEVAYYLWSRYGSSHNVSFVTVPFEGVVEEILNKVDNSQMGVILKRMMLRASAQVAKEMYVEAVVTGEAIAQVSSQTLTNLSVIDSVTDHLVLRPLVAMDKQDIINISTRIGTEEFVKNIPEYCAVISKNPTTKAKPEKIVHEESKFDFSVLDEAIATRRKVFMTDIVSDDLAREEVAVVDHTELNDVVIDIRHPDEEEIKPFSLPDQEVLTLPFYQLRTKFPELDKSKNYLLYCEKGVMSQLHAMHLRDEGHENVGVFSPKKDA
ncbi:tRNA 4-thiouridine(8) synthase ThiI [Endozoicomonas sp. OPT23]|uniref:tRNA uracil 4-sulfurtransferase ThiI n=1 Tax=Endozoicomonas sp. OPT23 TaxID=2072845 RepID=UPI00129A5B7F|nr:tRNA uracil 4-sulfurtransferase ThiI [Endozoicomonas sp. OPT23]MRI32552.1 tRNA 4-thiouridine(8) synthase ThiI [Endozoicomonas sp. OPT23]